MSNFQKPLLSVVATSRNDGHGGNALWRTQHFVSGLAAQALKFEFPIELVLVDWNPPADKEGLFEALEWPTDNPYFTYRVIQVPNEYHSRFKFADKLPLFQYIAKNVGIRRATGDYVLSTNIDILFSNELMGFLKNGLEPNQLYRVDRYDVDLDESVSPSLPFQDILKTARENCVRVNRKRGTTPYSMGFLARAWVLFKHVVYVCVGYVWRRLQRIWDMLKDGVKRPLDFPRNLKKTAIGLYTEEKFFFKYITALLFTLPSKIMHTNTCGDFTLMSKADWDRLRGYPEWEIYSWHIDSVLIYQAHYNFIQMHNLPTSHSIYHIEHDRGSGWTPEGASLLFGRLDERGIGYMTDKDLEKEFEEQRKLKKKGKPVIYNDDQWGIFGADFPEKGSASLK